jgi:SET domain-containing protein
MANNRKRLGNIVYKAPSEIHGNGLFAKVSINKGEYIGTYEGPEAKRDGTYVLWVFEDDKQPVGRSGRNLLRYLNHQDKGNAEFDGFDLFALKNIKPNEEITFDYGGWEEE